MPHYNVQRVYGSSTREVLHVSWAKVTQGSAIVLVAVRLRRCISRRASERDASWLSLTGLPVPSSRAQQPHTLVLCESDRVAGSTAIRRIFTSSITRGELISRQSSPPPPPSRVLPSGGCERARRWSRWEQDGGRDRAEKGGRDEGLRAVRFYVVRRWPIRRRF